MTLNRKQIGPGFGSVAIAIGLKRQLAYNFKSSGNFLNKCHRRMCGISHGEHKTNEYARQQVDIIAGCQEHLPSQAIMVRPCLSSWYAAEHHWGLQGTVDGVVVAEEDFAYHGRTTSRNGQANRWRHCFALRMTQINGLSSQQMHLSEYPPTTPGRHGY